MISLRTCMVVVLVLLGACDIVTGLADSEILRVAFGVVELTLAMAIVD